MSNDNRVPAGSPEGGQWAKGTNPESETSLSTLQRVDIDIMDYLHDDDGTTTSAHLTLINAETSAVTTTRKVPLTSEARLVAAGSPRVAQIASVSRLHLNPRQTNVAVDPDAGVVNILETTMVPANASPDEALDAHCAETSHRASIESINGSIATHAKAWGVDPFTQRQVHGAAVYDPTSPLVREDFEAASRPLSVRPAPGFDDLESRVPDTAMQPLGSTGPRITNERRATEALDMNYVEDNDDGTQAFTLPDGRRADVAWNRSQPVTGQDDDARRASEGERVRTALRNARIYPSGHRGLATTCRGMENPTDSPLTDEAGSYLISEDGYIVQGRDGSLQMLSGYAARRHFDLSE